MARVYPFRRTKNRLLSSSSGDGSSEQLAWLCLANKLQILALDHADVVRVLEKIVDGVLSELERVDPSQPGDAPDQEA
jgi:hypothetical protein